MRQIMGIGDWQEQIDFNWRRIRDNVTLLQAQTIKAISHKIVDEAYRLVPDAVKKQRADSFVVETDIHYPTESSLIFDGIRKTIELCVELYEVYDISGWRQHEYLIRKAKQINRQIGRISSRKGADYQARMAQQYRQLLDHAEMILDRGTRTCETLENEFDLDLVAVSQIAEIKVFMQRTQQFVQPQ